MLLSELLKVVSKNELVKVFKNEKLLIKLNTSDLNDEDMKVLSKMKVELIVNATSFIKIKVK